MRVRSLDNAQDARAVSGGGAGGGGGGGYDGYDGDGGAMATTTQRPPGGVRGGIQTSHGGRGGWT